MSVALGKEFNLLLLLRSKRCLDDLTDAVFEEFGRDWVLLERVCDLIPYDSFVDLRADLCC